MGARKDMGKTFSRLTQEDVDSFCEQWDIDPSVNPVAPGCNKPIDQCPSGFIALYCCHFEFSNLRYPFSVFVLNVLEYYHVSFGQLHPHGVSRVLHFEVLCRALGYDPTLLMFRRFFRLAKNGDWFTFETSQIDVYLISSLVTTLGSLKDRFFWVSELVIPFKMVWRHPNAILNELEPFASELDEGMLEALRACPSRLRPFPEHLLVFTGVSILWDKPNRDPIFMRGDQVMSALDFIKSDDTSDVVLGDVEAIEGDDAITRTAEGRLVPGGSMLACQMLRVS
ncbi:hypothetical protein Hdeb2414_s0017g00510721 [Helianthus debilis subsp. tardiflorus]